MIFIVFLVLFALVLLFVSFRERASLHSEYIEFCESHKTDRD